MAHTTEHSKRIARVVGTKYVITINIIDDASSIFTKS